MYKYGDKFTHIPTNKKCVFKEYETEKNQYMSDDCCWVIFDRIWFRRNVEGLVYLGNIERRR